MSESEDKQERQDTIAGLAALIVVLVFAFNDIPYAGAAVVIILFLNFLWSYLRRHERQDGSHKAAGKTFVAGSCIILVIVAVSFLLDPTVW
ncbi:hypothetical protein [Salimicrobium halophilum]|uniref:Uncharacterized protein n=1 Tax=Salimicrobium halophilum TaxID=86666 RepID=A0A1G8UFA2_9BACI|nr:hypothetical protein [Salimicrobium halophilum]SDJ51700.1 hypothetical protein SAMN04490247_2189 [Salimicrobium halophilum]